MKLRLFFAALVLGVLSTGTARAGFSITIAPPPLLVYEQPYCPVEGYLWTPGYWAYDEGAGDYYWVDGVWVAPPRIGYLWTPGYWGFGDGFYAFHRGYWGPAVGFYGGINYGFGYGGYGYYGGRWDRRVFRYNTAVTRVNVTNIHNTYVDRSVIRDATRSRAAFNGRGGVNARPDAGQLAAAIASHLDATAAQTRAMRQARSVRPDGRNRTAKVTAGGRTNDIRRTPRNARANPAFVNNQRSRGAFPRQGAVRPDRAGRQPNLTARGAGRNQFNGPGRGRSRAPQVTRQARAPQPRGGQPKAAERRN